MGDTSIVFRGTVLQRKVLPRRADMQTRDRYATTFRVEKFWKGSPGRNVTVYTVDGDCFGNGGYQVGKNYLVFATESSTEVVIGGLLWYSWTDVLSDGAKVLMPRLHCSRGGETSVSTVRQALTELGKGRSPHL
jgi:hypothetical protein